MGRAEHPLCPLVSVGRHSDIKSKDIYIYFFMNLNKMKYEENKPFHPFRVLQRKTRHTAKRARQSLFKIRIKMEAVNSKECFVSGVPHVLNECLHNFVAVRHVGDHICHVVL